MQKHLKLPLNYTALDAFAPILQVIVQIPNEGHQMSG